MTPADDWAAALLSIEQIVEGWETCGPGESDRKLLDIRNVLAAMKAAGTFPEESAK